MAYPNLDLEAINAKLRELNQDKDPLNPVHFSWYQYYIAIPPEQTLQLPMGTITLSCSRHNTIFTTKYRYIIDRKKSATTLCPECHYEFDKEKLGGRFSTKYRDLAKTFEQHPELGFVLSPDSENNNNVFLKNTDRVVVLCRQCHSPTEHKVDNLKTHIKNGHHLFCQHCSCKRKGKSRRISFEEAQRRVNKFVIDSESYQGFATPCLLTCRNCSQRHEWTPQAASKGQCVSCEGNGAMPLRLMPSLNDFSELLAATSSWQLSTEPSHIQHNESTYALRQRLPEDAGVYLQCKTHPKNTKYLRLRSMHKKVQAHRCRACEAQRKCKYTIQYLDRLFADANIPICIDAKASDLEQDSGSISSTHPLRIRCMRHGILPESYRTYDLKRYVRDYRFKNPCPYCQPDTGLGLNAQRVRRVVESNNTWSTHGALYNLHETDHEVDANIKALKVQNKVPYDELMITVAIQQTLESALGLPLPTPAIVKMKYKEFKKGKKGYISRKQHVSWLAKFIEYLGHLWLLGLEAEVTFDGLLSKKGRKFRIDYYQSTLNWAIEIDGLQHASENDQIQGKSKRERKFAEQQARDATVNTYFDTKPEITLIRVPCYYETNSGQFKPLTIQQQYDASVQLCQQVHIALHGTRAPEPDKSLILAQTRNHTTDSEYLLNHLNKQYNGKIQAIKYRLEDDKPRIILKCKQGHITQVCLAKAYGDIKHIDKKADSTKPLCWACLRQLQFDQAKQRLLERDMIWINEQELRTKFHGTLSNPLNTKGTLKRIVLLCAHENDQVNIIEITLNKLLP